MAQTVLKRNFGLFRSAEDGHVYLFLRERWYDMSNAWSLGKMDIPGGYKECVFLGNIGGMGEELAAMIEVSDSMKYGNPLDHKWENALTIDDFLKAKKLLDEEDISTRMALGLFKEEKYV